MCDTDRMLASGDQQSLGVFAGMWRGQQAGPLPAQCLE